MDFKVLSLAFLMILISCTHQSVLFKSESNRNPGSLDSKAYLRSDYVEGEISNLCDEKIKLLKSNLEQWERAYAGNGTAVQALLDFENNIAKFWDNVTPLQFLSNVSTKKYQRDEASSCRKKAGIFTNEIFTNRNFYNRLKGIVTKDSDQARLLKETLALFEENGMKLSDENLKAYKFLADRLTQQAIQFRQNITDDVSTVIFSKADLDGVQSDFLERLKQDDNGNYIVTTKEPDFTHVMENARNSETRKKMMFNYHNRQAEINTPILAEVLQIRSQIARLMGFKTYADYILKTRMAGNSKMVWGFLKGLQKKLNVKYEKELEALKTFKNQDLEDSSPLTSWDLAYVSNQLKIKKFEVNQDLVREYFPAQRVVDQTFAIYSQLLGVQFREIKGVPVWADQVKLFEVTDQESKKVIAYFYTDLVPRDGKSSGAYAAPIISGRVLEDSSYQAPISLIVANFSPPTANKPSLLRQNEIQTFFHEFGHIMHQLLTRAPYGSLSGTSVKQDFVEAPSQMLENWIWDAKILEEMSQHYQDHKKIPPDLISKLINLKFFNIGIQNMRQLVFGMYDMEIHTNEKVDANDIYAKIHKKLTGFAPLEGTHFPATFGHIMGGYAAGYYSYLWSRVYAEDMFSEFAKVGIMNRELGRKYRKEILEKGNMSDPLVLIENFLGRKSNNKAFFKSLGLE